MALSDKISWIKYLAIIFFYWHFNYQFPHTIFIFISISIRQNS